MQAIYWMVGVLVILQVITMVYGLNHVQALKKSLWRTEKKVEMILKELDLKFDEKLAELADQSKEMASSAVKQP
jgi:hypothetical protein